MENKDATPDPAKQSCPSASGEATGRRMDDKQTDSCQPQLNVGQHSDGDHEPPQKSPAASSPSCTIHNALSPPAVDQASEDISQTDKPSAEISMDTAVQSLICQECDLTFVNDTALKAHQLTHKADSQYVCGICGKGFSNANLLSGHFSMHSESRRYACPDCGRIFRNLVSFQQHEKLHKSGEMFTCRHCGKAFRRQSILQKHRYSHMKKVRIEYACEYCNKCFGTVMQLQQHEQEVHNGWGKGNKRLRHTCEECGQSFRNQKQLTEHCKWHVLRKTNHCKDCGREYDTPSALEDHRCFRTRRASFMCKECGRRFVTKQESLDHERTHYEIEREFDCDVCFESFSSDFKLKKHATTHRRYPSFQCKHCGKEFKKKGFLTNHEKSHLNQRDKCDTKSKSVQSESSSNGISKTAVYQKKERNRVFPCPKCQNTYLTKTQLKAHMLTHSAKKSLDCEACGRKFNYKGNLNRHQLKCSKMKNSDSVITERTERSSRRTNLTQEKSVPESPRHREIKNTDSDDHSGNNSGQIQHQSFYNKDTKLYQCRDCGQTFKQRGQTLYHQKKVNNEREYSCKICNKAFLTSPHLKAHELVHTTEKPLTCEGCGKGFNYKCNLKMHQRNGCLGLDQEGELALSNMKLYKCNECGKEFKLKMYFEKHQKMHANKSQEQGVESEVLVDVDETGARREHRSDFNEEEGTYKCRDCDLVFKQSGQALYHSRKYTNERRFVCKVCPKSFLTSAHLKSHIMSHTKEKPFKCWYCGKGFNHNSNRRYHQRTSCGERPPGNEAAEESRQENKGHDDVKKPITCVVCNKQFMLTHSWKVHMRVHTKEQPFLCEYCGKAFRCRSNLYVHRNSHTKERPYLCNYCGKNFAQLSHVRVHEAIHNTDKPHKCTTCGKSFAQEFYLNRHKVMHTDDRPFVCFCGKSFKYRGSLVSHKATHSTKRPYSCHLCDKAFKQSCHLKVHILTHGTMKPYKCEKCQKAFIRKNQLSRHQRSHSDERCYLCNVCGKDFKHSSSMKRHQERKHGKEHFDTNENSTTTNDETQPGFDSMPFLQPLGDPKKNEACVDKSKSQWPVADNQNTLEQDNSMQITGHLEATSPVNHQIPSAAQHVENGSLAQMDSQMTVQPIDYRVSPQLTDPRMTPQPVTSSGHAVYSEAQYVQGSEFASVHLPHIGTFDFRTSSTGMDYTIL